MKRLVTYDIKSGNDYSAFYDYVDKVNALQLTESTYLLETTLNQEEFERKIISLFSKGDNVHYVTVNEHHNLITIKIPL